MKTLPRPLLLLAGLFASGPLLAALDLSDAEAAAIKAPAFDYVESWYAGDAGRMERALHPDLAKRNPGTDPATGKPRLEHMGREQLVQYTRDGVGSKTPPEQQRKEVTILDAYADIAVVKIVSSAFVDYVEEVKIDGRWVIVNVLWRYKTD